MSAYRDTNKVARRRVHVRHTDTIKVAIRRVHVRYTGATKGLLHFYCVEAFAEYAGDVGLTDKGVRVDGLDDV